MVRMAAAKGKEPMTLACMLMEFVDFGKLCGWIGGLFRE
jgi:chemotaxis methyl-accepting protein methylase